MKYILQMCIFIFPPHLMYRGHIFSKQEEGGEDTVSVAEVLLVGKGLKTEPCGRPHAYLILQTAGLGK